MAWAGVGAENSAAFPEEGHEGPQSQPPCIESAGEAQGSLKRLEETFIPGSTAENHADGGGAVEEILQDHETAILQVRLLLYSHTRRCVKNWPFGAIKPHWTPFS